MSRKLQEVFVDSVKKAKMKFGILHNYKWMHPFLRRILHSYFRIQIIFGTCKYIQVMI